MVVTPGPLCVFETCHEPLDRPGTSAPRWIGSVRMELLRGGNSPNGTAESCQQARPNKTSHLNNGGGSAARCQKRMPTGNSQQWRK